MTTPGRIYGARTGVPSALAGNASAADLSPPAASVDLSRYADYVDSQIGSRCVEDMLVGMHHVVRGGKGALLSARAWYVAARVRERARAGDAIADTGSFPADAIDAAIAVGVPRADPGDVDPDAINLLETWDELADAAGYRFAPEDFVTPSDGDLDTLDRWLSLGATMAASGAAPGPYAAGFVMPVTSAYETLQGSGCRYDGDAGDVLGFHAQAILGYTGLADSDYYRVWGSWSRGWGDQGFALVRRGFVRSPGSSLLILRGGPAT